MKKTIEITIIAILLTSAIFSSVYTMITEYTVGTKFYAGFSLLVIVNITRFISKQISNYLLGALLLLGTFRLILYSHIDHSIGFSIGPIGINFNIFLLFLFLFYLSVNGSEISKLLGEKELTEEEKQAETRKLVEMYKAQHTNKSKDELQNMVDNPDHRRNFGFGY
jgi:hypothetical protein